MFCQREAAWRYKVGGPKIPDYSKAEATSDGKEVQAIWPDGVVWKVVGALPSQLQIKTEKESMVVWEGCHTDGQEVTGARLALPNQTKGPGEPIDESIQICCSPMRR